MTDWTSPERRRLLRLYAAGLPQSAICRVLGRHTVAEINAELTRAGRPSRKGVYLFTELDLLVLGALPGTISELAFSLERSYEGVMHSVKRLKTADYVRRTDRTGHRPEAPRGSDGRYRPHGDPGAIDAAPVGPMPGLWERTEQPLPFDLHELEAPPPRVTGQRLMMRVAERLEQPEESVAAIWEAILEEINAALADGAQTVELPRLGVFKRWITPGRSRRDWRTGEHIQCKPKTKIKIQLLKTLEQKLCK